MKCLFIPVLRKSILIFERIIKMKKTIVLIIVLVLSIPFFVSCSAPFNKFNWSSDEKKAQKTAEKICDLINEKDAQSLKNMFSVKVQNECPDLDTQIEALLAVVGECTMTDFSYGEAEAITYGIVEKEYKCMVFLKGDEEFDLYFIQVARNDNDKESVGLTTIFLCASSIDEGKFQEWKQKSVEAGTYPPVGIGIYTDN